MTRLDVVCVVIGGSTRVEAVLLVSLRCEAVVVVLLMFAGTQVWRMVIVGGGWTEAVVVHVGGRLAGAALGGLAGVAGRVGLLELADVGVRGLAQVVVPAAGPGDLGGVTWPGLVCPARLARHLATVTLVAHTPTH